MKLVIDDFTGKALINKSEPSSLVIKKFNNRTTGKTGLITDEAVAEILKQ